jgi:hypothetical protein
MSLVKANRMPSGITPDDRARHVVDLDRAPEDCWIRVVPRPPQAVADDHNRRGFRAVLLRREVTS